MAEPRMSVTAKLLIVVSAILYVVSVGAAYYKGKMDGMQIGALQRYDKAAAVVGKEYDAFKQTGINAAAKSVDLATSAISYWKDRPQSKDAEDTTATEKPGLFSRVFRRDKNSTVRDEQTTPTE